MSSIIIMINHEEKVVLSSIFFSLSGRRESSVTAMESPMEKTCLWRSSGPRRLQESSEEIQQGWLDLLQS